MSTVKEPPHGERTLVDGDALIASTDINSTPGYDEWLEH